MAAGSSFKPERAAGQAALSSNQAVGSNAVRTALWGVGVALLSNIANILKQLHDALESVQQIEQFVTEHVWISVVLVGGVALWGNALLFRFLYHRLKRRIPTAYKVLAAIACMALVSGIFVTNLFSLRSFAENTGPIRTKLVNELRMTQDLSGGGFFSTTRSDANADAWTTGQALKAELLSGSYDPNRVKQAFSYIEQQRLEDGFNMYLGTTTRPFIRTEAAAWVAIAYLQSLTSANLWTKGERPDIVDRTTKTLQTIISQQAQKGGWAPVPTLKGHERTYATMMSTWALTEALLSPDIPVEAKQSYGAAFELGVQWLIRHYEDKIGWEEDPHHKLNDPYPGLTYQVLFVLERAQLVAGHNAFKDLEEFHKIKAGIKDLIQPAEVKDTTAVPPSNIMIDNYPCWADVLAYPWLLSALPPLIADPDISPENRRYLKGVLKQERAKIHELPASLIKTETWKIAEDLIGLSNLINGQPATPQ